jgi:hypothetical protein
MIDPHVAESLAVSYGAEDYYGLHELVWGLNTHYPAEAPEAKLSAAMSAIRELLGLELVTIHASDQDRRPLADPLPAAKAVAVVGRHSAWETPGGTGPEGSFWFTTTSKGEAALGAGQYKSL